MTLETPKILSIARSYQLLPSFVAEELSPGGEEVVDVRRSRQGSKSTRVTRLAMSAREEMNDVITFDSSSSFDR